MKRISAISLSVFSIQMLLVWSCTSNVGNQTNPQEQINSDCGNGEIDGVEDCDGTNINGGTCINQGLEGPGPLGCYDNCHYDFSNCEQPDSNVTISSISANSLLHGQSYTLTGSGFGSKSQAAPLQWDDFEDGAPGVDIPNGHNDWYVNVYSSYAPSTIGPLWSNEVPRGAGEISVKQGGFPNGTSHAPEFGISHTLPVDGQFYISAWFWGTSTGGSRSNKFFQYSADWSRPSIHTAGGGQDDYYRASIRDCGEGHAMLGNGHAVAHPYNNGWHRWEWFFQRSLNGIFQVFRDGVLQTEGTGDFTLGGCPIFLCFFNSYWGHWPDNDTASWSSYWDEIYFDTTRARVEICSGPNKSTADHCEIQIGQTWSGNSIEFRVNQGSFPSGSAYVFVVDSTGSPSNGHLIHFQ